MTYDFLMLNPASDTPLYQQLYESLRRSIERGHLTTNEKLPSIRKLSEDLRLSRTTVEMAYQQLCVEGYVRARPQSGFFVEAGAIRPERSSHLEPPQTIVQAERPGPNVRYNFGSDSVDSGCIDIKIWRRHIRDVLTQQEVLTSYGDPQGEPALREALSSYCYGVRGVKASPEQIVVGAGTQPLLYLLCGLLPEKTVAIDERGFPQAERVFADCGFTVLRLPTDRDGIRMDALEVSGVRAVLVRPSHSVSSGTAMPMSRRFALLEWAKAHQSLVIEDDYNGELRYNARPIPAMQGIADGELVAYIGSFSKLLLPSVRIGYMALPPALLADYRSRAKSYNQTASKVEQLALSNYVKSGQLERHLRRLRKLYAAKSAELSRSVRSAFGRRCRLFLQETALRLTLYLPCNTPSEDLCRRAIQRGVRVIAETEPGSVTLGFAGIPLEDIAPAVEQLHAAWSDLLGPSKGVERKAAPEQGDAQR